MAVETSGGVRWMRRNGRLSRVEIKVEDEDLAVIGVDNQVAIEKLIVQKTVRRKSVVLRGKSDQDWTFFKLPLEIQMMVFDHISTEDVKNMAKTCKAMKEFVNYNFVVNVILPLSAQNQKLLAGRYVLDLTSTVDIKLWMLGEFFGMIKNMNLVKLKRLKFNGPNFILKQGRYQGLSSRYLNTLEHITSISKALQSVEILIDKSFFLEDIIEKLSRFPTLKDVTLRSSGDIGRIIQTDRKENRTMTMNKLIGQLLKNEAIEKLKLKGFSVPWDFHMSGYETYQLFIKSESLQSLNIEYSKAFEIGNIEAENLKEIDLDGGFWKPCCLYHSGGKDPYSDQNEMGTLAPVLANGCPRLERFNKLDIKKLKDEQDDGDWLKQLSSHYSWQ